MKFDILTIFPESFSYLSQSILGKAIRKGIIEVNIYDIRKYSSDKHHKVDGKAFGGLPGMVMRIQPIHECLLSIGAFPKKDKKTIVILMQAGGDLWDQSKAKSFALNYDRIVLICGHYQGVDDRVTQFLVDAEISVGEYVLTGGEVPAMIVIDSVARLIKGTVGNTKSLQDESYSEDIKKAAPLYTIPRSFKLADGRIASVPDVLLAGDHKQIQKWRDEKILRKSRQNEHK